MKRLIMKNLALFLVLTVVFVGCGTTSDKMVASNSTETNYTAEDTVRIANDEIEYEIIIIEPGFNNWLVARARPEGYYTQEFLESRNIIYVNAWNNRAMNPSQYSPNLYTMPIDYRPDIDYGYEVNYKLYYYFIYFQRTYNQRLSGFVPRI